jgi:propionate catabolism operon transcriptional regulator
VPAEPPPIKAADEQERRVVDDVASAPAVSIQPVLTQEVPAPAQLTAAVLEERERIVRTLTECVGNQTESARRLGVSRSSLIDRIKRFRIPRPRAGF